jgi:oligopeptide/dipeptide ABC transporter ATP-binding protein
VHYHGSSTPAVADASFEISRGAAIGIVGESGSGKTTLARTLVGTLTPTRGEVRIEGRRWEDVRRTDPLRRKVQMIFQDPYASLNPLITARDAVAEVVQVWHGSSRKVARESAFALLAEVGLGAAAANSYPRRLSGGQRQRVGIARALACEPEALIADEPTSSLDVSVQAQILNLLVTLREQRELALVLISHDLSVVRHMTNEALVMYAGHIVERGTTAELFKDPRHPYTRVLVDSVPDASGKSRFARNELTANQGCVFAPRCPFVADKCVSKQPLLTWNGERSVACFFPLRNNATPNGHEPDERPLARRRQ